MSIEEIRDKSEAEILKIKPDVVDDMKPEVKAEYQKRMDAIKSKKTAQ